MSGQARGSGARRPLEWDAVIVDSSEDDPELDDLHDELAMSMCAAAAFLLYSPTYDSGLLGRMVLAVEDMSRQRREKNEKLESRREQAIERLRSMNMPPRIFSLAEDAILGNKETASRHHLHTVAEFRAYVLTRLSLIRGDKEVDDYLRDARRGAGN